MASSDRRTEEKRYGRGHAEKEDKLKREQSKTCACKRFVQKTRVKKKFKVKEEKIKAVAEE